MNAAFQRLSILGMSKKAKLTASVALLLTCGAIVLLVLDKRNAGRILDTYKGVAVYDNGPLISKSHGRHYSPSGYYYGQKWQCVEFVKRFYAEAKHHQMPDLWGHAKDFFDETLSQGALNTRRGLLQFQNGGNQPVAVDDLVVFPGGYGHVAIVSEVGSNYVEVVQQNIFGKPRQRLQATATNGVFTIAPKRTLGWLRLPPR